MNHIMYLYEYTIQSKQTNFGNDYYFHRRYLMSWWQWQRGLNSIKRDVIWIIIVVGAEEESPGRIV